VEANLWGFLFYGTELDLEPSPAAESLRGINPGAFVGFLLLFVRHAHKVLSASFYRGPLSATIKVGGVRGVPWLYFEYGTAMRGPSSELDDGFSFSVPTTTDELETRPSALVGGMLKQVLFGTNMSNWATQPDQIEALLKLGREYNHWAQPQSK
jgi:hypothetical protein